MKLIHIIAGFLALASGAVALYSFKGGNLHRKGGTTFVYAMLVMAGIGAFLAALKPERLSVIGGVLAGYMVSTAMLTVRRRPGEEFNWLNHAAMLVAFVAGITCIKFGFDARDNADGRLDRFPAPMYFTFGTIALLAAFGDVRMLLARDIHGARRIMRHHWRMGFAMFMATGSFFLGQAQVFPEALRKGPLLAIPVLLVAVTVLYWVVRTRLARRRAERRSRAPRPATNLLGEPS